METDRYFPVHSDLRLVFWPAEPRVGGVGEGDVRGVPEDRGRLRLDLATVARGVIVSTPSYRPGHTVPEGGVDPVADEITLGVEEAVPGSRGGKDGRTHSLDEVC